MFQELGGAFGIALGVAAFDAAGGHPTPTDATDGFAPRWPSRPRSRLSCAASRSRSPDQKDCDHADVHINHSRRHHADRDSAGLDRARRGDHDAFDALIEPLRDQLLAHCYRMLGSIHDADDALQETMLRAWKGLPRFDGRSELSTWLYRIATNASFDAISRNARRVLPVDLTRTRQRTRRRHGGSNRSPTRSDPKVPRQPWCGASRSSWRS